MFCSAFVFQSRICPVLGLGVSQPLTAVTFCIALCVVLALSSESLGFLCKLQVLDFFSGIRVEIILRLFFIKNKMKWKTNENTLNFSPKMLHF